MIIDSQVSVSRKRVDTRQRKKEGRQSRKILIWRYFTPSPSPSPPHAPCIAEGWGGEGGGEGGGEEGGEGGGEDVQTQNNENTDNKSRCWAAVNFNYPLYPGKVWGEKRHLKRSWEQINAQNLKKWLTATYFQRVLQTLKGGVKHMEYREI